MGMNLNFAQPGVQGSISIAQWGTLAGIDIIDCTHYLKVSQLPPIASLAGADV